MKIIQKQTKKSTRFLGISATLSQDDVNLFSQNKKKFKIVSSQKLPFLRTGSSPQTNEMIPRLEKRNDQEFNKKEKPDKIIKKRNLNLKNLMQYYIEVPSVSYEIHDNKKGLSILEKYSISQRSASSKLFKQHILDYLLHELEYKKMIIFISDIHSNTLLKEHLTDSLNEKILLITGNQSQKERLYSLNKFKQDKNIRILITTDLLSRGIDVNIVDLVVNFELPRDIQTYFHRVGRCGRYGNFGCSFIFLDHKSLSFLRNHQNFFIDFKRIGEQVDFPTSGSSLKFINGVGSILADKKCSTKSIISRLLSKKKNPKDNKKAHKYLNSFKKVFEEINSKIKFGERHILCNNPINVSSNEKFDIMGKWVDSTVELYDKKHFNYVKEEGQDNVSVSSKSLNEEEKNLIGDN
jgi:superfamily II DNA/RNA helicase